MNSQIQARRHTPTGRRTASIVGWRHGESNRKTCKRCGKLEGLWKNSMGSEETSARQSLEARGVPAEQQADLDQASEPWVPVDSGGIVTSRKKNESRFTHGAVLTSEPTSAGFHQPLLQAGEKRSRIRMTSVPTRNKWWAVQRRFGPK